MRVKSKMDALDLIFKNLRELIEGPKKPLEDETTPEYTNMVKSETIGDKRLFTAVVLRPNEVDLHGDIYDYETVEKACHEYNEFCGEGNLQHLIQTKLVVPVESYISKTSHIEGNGQIVAGDWVMTVRVDDDEVWDMCQKGLFTGFSVGCKSLSREVEGEIDLEKAWADKLVPLKGDDDDQA